MFGILQQKMIGAKNHRSKLNGIQGIVLDISCTEEIFIYLFPSELLAYVKVKEKNKKLNSPILFGEFLRYNEI